MPENLSFSSCTYPTLYRTGNHTLYHTPKEKSEFYCALTCWLGTMSPLVHNIFRENPKFHRGSESLVFPMYVPLRHRRLEVNFPVGADLVPSLLVTLVSTHLYRCRIFRGCYYEKSFSDQRKPVQNLTGQQFCVTTPSQPRVTCIK